MEQIGSKPDNPVWTAFVPVKPSTKNLLIVMAFSIAPVAIAVLMQKPALRQAIQMRAFHTSKTACQYAADFFQSMATKSAQEYQKARG
jgi:hypothetical protein